MPVGAKEINSKRRPKTVYNFAKHHMTRFNDNEKENYTDMQFHLIDLFSI